MTRSKECWFLRRTILVALLVVVALPSTALIYAAQAQQPSAEAGYLRTDGSWIVDSNGAIVLLRGANLRGYHFGYPSFWQTVHSEADYANMKSWGFNAVRLLLAWSNVEPRKGVYDDQYLGYVDRDIAWAKKYGIYVILEFHQNKWNSKWDGNGAPDWAVTQYSADEAGFVAAVTDFWNSQELRAHFTDAWKHVVQRYSNEPTVVGYDILNEPYLMFDESAPIDPSTRWNTILGLYEQVVQGIRTVDINHMVFVEPDPDALSYLTAFDDSNVVWAPHFYYYVYYPYGKPYFHDNATYLSSSLDALYQKIVVGLQQPLWIGEFGMEMWVQGSDLWAKDTVQLFEEYGIGWAWWTYWKSDQPDMCLLNSDGTPRQYFLQYLSDPSLTFLTVRRRK
jgi:endoglycosylceramidase